MATPEETPASDAPVEEPVETAKAEDAPIETLRAELAALTALVKAHTAEPDILDLLQKAGRRNSAADMELIQHCHDLTKSLGATCNPPEDEDAPPMTEALEGTVLTLKDAEPVEPPVYSFDPQMLEAVMRTALRETVKDSVAAAISRARGRLD